MPKGASPKREHEYQQLETRFKQEGRYPGREEEVAARIVNKQRAASGETETAPADKPARRVQRTRHPSRRGKVTRRET